MSVALKLTITPAAIALATAIARRWGPSYGGWIAAIPFTSAPVVAFLALEHGIGFADAAAVGVLAGTASQAAFALGYSWIALRLRWYVALVVASAGFAACTLALNTLTLTVASALAIVVGGIVLALAVMPSRPAATPDLIDTHVPVLWDAVLRAVIATAAVVTVTAIAHRVGATLAGLLSPYPLFGALFMIFPHRRDGGVAAVAAARGLLWGLFACCGFFAVLAELLPSAPMAAAYLLAIAAGLVIQGITLAVLRRWTVRVSSS